MYQIIVKLIPLVERNYEKLTQARQTYTNLYYIYQAIKGYDLERIEFINKCNEGKKELPESPSLNHVLANLIPIIFSHQNSKEDLLESMKAMKQ